MTYGPRVSSQFRWRAFQMSQAHRIAKRYPPDRRAPTVTSVFKLTILNGHLVVIGSKKTRYQGDIRG
jgi:hypothetical protein